LLPGLISGCAPHRRLVQSCNQRRWRTSRFLNGIEPVSFKTLDLSNTQFEQLISCLSQAPTRSLKELQNSAVGKVSGVSPDDLADIVSTVFSLNVVKAQAELSAKRFAADVIEALGEAGTVDRAGASLASMQANLERILSIDPLINISKGIGLLAEQPRTFCDSRILTDLRPVFHDDSSQPAVGAVIIHSLKIEYHEDGEHKEFFVALDSDDIENLVQVLKRASTKANSLRTLMAEARLPNFNIDIA